MVANGLLYYIPQRLEETLLFHRYSTLLFCFLDLLVHETLYSSPDIKMTVFDGISLNASFRHKMAQGPLRDVLCDESKNYDYFS